MRHRVVTLAPFRIVGAGTRIPLVYHGANPDMIEFHDSLPDTIDRRLLELSDMPEPAGPFPVSTGFSEDRADGSEFHYLYAVATRRAAADLPRDLDVVEVPEFTWIVFEVEADAGFSRALQQVWADAFSEWLPANRYRAAPAPEILVVRRQSKNGDAGRAELWVAVEEDPGVRR